MKFSPKFMAFFEKYMIVAGSIGHFLFFLQAFKIISTQCSHDVSLGGFLFSLFSMSNWLVYGILTRNKVVALTNIIGVTGATICIICILIYS